MNVVGRLCSRGQVGIVGLRQQDQSLVVREVLVAQLRMTVEAEPGDCVWVRSVIVPLGRHWMESRETFYVVRVDEAKVVDDNWEPQERAVIVDHRWWTVPEIAASSEWFAPRHLATLLPPVLQGEHAGEPLSIGA